MSFSKFAILFAAMGVYSLSNAADDPVSHPYQSLQNGTCDGAAAQCTVGFPAITTGRTLLKRVSCDYLFPPGSAGDLISAQVEVFDPSGPQPIAFSDLQAFPYAVYYPPRAEVGTARFGINSDLYLFAGKGQTIQVTVSASVPLSSLVCTLAGYYL